MTGVTTTTSTKRKLRIENKKKKMAALLDIAKLNEYDRQKNKHSKVDVETESSTVPPEPSPKKLKTDDKSNETSERPQLPKLHGEELIELKRMLREKTNKIRNTPKFRLREMGENASLKLEIDSRCPLFISDLQHLIMYSQIGPHSPYSPARWCAMDKYTRLVNVNILIVENVSLYHFVSNESQFPFLSSTFEHKLEFIAPTSYNSDIVKDLSMVPLSSTMTKKLINEYGTLEKAVEDCSEIFDTLKNFFPIDSSLDDGDRTHDDSLPPSDKFSRTQLLMSGWQMIEENYPLPIKGLMERKYSGYVLTKDGYKDVTPFSPMYGVDCEMCKTTIGDLELTRVSVVNEKHEVFYDTLVKPANRIVDYLTKYSGITPKMMHGVTTTLKNVQDDLRRLLPNDAILVGQSLGNDLHALKMMHPYIIDTSIIFNVTGDRMRKTKLQTLSREFLQEKIQASRQGHCSTEDSLACMKLTQLKLRRHLYYGDAVMNSIYTQTRTYPDIGTATYASSMLKQCTKVDKKASVIGVDDIGLKYEYYVNKNTKKEGDKNITCKSEKTNKEVIKQLCDNLNDYALNIGHIRVADNQLDGSTKVFKTLDKWVKELYEKTTMPSFLMVLLGGQKEGGNGACFLQMKREFV